MPESFINRLREKGQEALVDEPLNAEEALVNQQLLSRFRNRGREVLTPVEQSEQERKEKTGGSLAGSTFAAVGAVGLGTGVLLGEILRRAMKVDFDANGINAANEDATKMFSKGYDWAYGKKKAA